MKSKRKDLVLWLLYYFAHGAGIITFRIEMSPLKGDSSAPAIRAVKCRWYTFFSIALRFVFVFVFIFIIIYSHGRMVPRGKFTDVLDFQHTFILTVATVFCSVGLIVIQIACTGRLVDLANSFFRLFNRVRNLVPQQTHTIGTYHTVLIFIKLLSLFYDVVINIVSTYANSNQTALTCAIILYRLLPTYLIIGVSMMLHVCFFGYIGISTLYESVNSYLLNDFRTRLQRCDYSLKRKEELSGTGILNGRHSRKLSSLSADLDKCGALLDEITLVCQHFHSMLEFSVLYTIIFNFIGQSVCVYSIVRHYHLGKSISWNEIFFAGKLFSDILLLTLAAHSVVKNSQLMKRMSLDSICAVTNHQEWETTVETFHNRCNLKALKLNLMGLCDLSNKMNLIYLSGIVTYVTYILQSAIQR